MSRAEQLTPRQARFVDEYLVDLNGTQAAIRAGYSPKGADVRGAELLGNRRVQELVQARMAARAKRVQIDHDWVLARLIAVAEADPRELVQYHRGACPDCWDGADYDPERADPACRKCRGRGRGHVVVSDTRHLSSGAQRLYAGVQVGKDGIRVHMHDKMTALTNIARHLGMFTDKLEVTGKDGGPIEVEDARNRLRSMLARKRSAAGA